MKKLILEIVIIVVAGVVLALFYNYFSEKSIPLIPKSQIEMTVKENELDNLLKADSAKPNEVAINTVSNKDTSNKSNSANQNEKITASQNKSDTATKAELRFVTYKQIMKYLNNPKVQFIDARFDAEDYKKSHIGNAINVTPWKNGELVNFDNLLINLSHNNIFIVYCDGGTCDDSKMVAKRMLELGFKKVFVYAEGWDEWSKMNK